MLAWEVFVYRQPAGPQENLVASWRVGFAGLRWIDQLVARGEATDHGGIGYPCRYSVSAGILLPILAAGLPENDSPLVIGDDYVLPAKWSEGPTWNKDVAARCSPDEQLEIEAWDQS